MLTQRLRAVGALCVLVLLSGCGMSVDYSPDGKKVVISLAQQGLVVANVDGSGWRRLPGTKDTTLALWSPDGRYILYERVGQQNEPRGVFLYDLQTKSSQALPGLLSTPFTFSADGSQIVVWDKKNSCLVWFDTSSRQRLLEVPCTVNLPTQRLLWLPDRHGVAFIGGGFDVYTVESGELYRITTTGDVIGLGLSEDGKQLLWVRQTGEGARAVFTAFAYDLDSRSVQKLAWQTTLRELMPAGLRRDWKTTAVAQFSPDGRSVALLLTYFREKQDPIWGNVWVLHLFDGGRVPLFATRLPTQPHWTPFAAAWSPNGKQVAVVSLWESLGETDAHVWICSAEGKQRRLLRL